MKYWNYTDGISQIGKNFEEKLTGDISIKHMDIYTTRLYVHASLPYNKMYQKHFVLESKLTEQIKERSF